MDFFGYPCKLTVHVDGRVWDITPAVDRVEGSPQEFRVDTTYALHLARIPEDQ